MAHTISFFRSSALPLILTAQLNFKTLNPSATKDPTTNILNTFCTNDTGCTTCITYNNTINDIAYIYYKSYNSIIRCIDCIR